MPDQVIGTAWAGFLLGLAGSFGHCLGMCGGVQALVDTRRHGVSGLWLAHVGRLTTYVVMGILAGAASEVVGGTEMAASEHGAHATAVGPSWDAWSRALVAFAGAGIATYMAFAHLGRVQGVDHLLAGAARGWGRAYRALRKRWTPLGPPPFLAGMLWGLLPCGLVITALLVATTSGSAAGGALVLGAFGLGTVPNLLVVAAVARRSARAITPWSRQLASLVTGSFGAQLAMRGLAAVGAVPHATIGPVALW